MLSPADETALRLAAFEFLDRAVAVHGESVPYSVLAREFRFRGEIVHLIGQQGIFKPRQSGLPISVATAPVVKGRPRPYDDRIGTDGTIRYKYRGSDPMHSENVGLRTLMQRRIPLIYFYGIAKGYYLPSWPTFVVNDLPDELAVEIQVDQRTAWGVLGADSKVAEPALYEDHERVLRRRFVTVEAQRRMHQAPFRMRVLRAYREHCAVCRLKQKPLLEAAHIIPDSMGGEPVVPNGIALCKLHHGAFDANILGVRPDLVLEVRSDILEEEDGPTLRHGLQAMHGSKLETPAVKRLRPDPVALEVRYEEFRRASG